MFTYFKNIFYLLFPFTSFLVLPFIQGTTPAFLLCFFFFLFLPLLVRYPAWKPFYKLVIGLATGFLFLIILAQAGVLFTGAPLLGGLPLVGNPASDTVFLRGSVFSQFLYFFASIIAFSLVVIFFRKKDLVYIFWAIRILIFYGLLEWTVFLFTGEKIDFISNRTFEGDSSGSLFQVMTIGGLNLQRLKSLTGEPSMFAFTLLPFWVLAIEYKKKWDIFFTTIGLILSLSTTAALGFVIYGIYKIFKSDVKTKVILCIGFFVVFAGIILTLGDTAQLIWEQLFLDKFSASSESGQDRSGNYYSGIDFWSRSNIWIKLFGIGFGIVRSTDFFTTVLVNEGLVGLGFWVLLFFFPFWCIPKKYKSEHLQKYFPCILIIFVSLFLSVPEYMYLSIWIPLGIVYHLVYDGWKNGNKLSSQTLPTNLSDQQIPHNV